MAPSYSTTSPHLSRRFTPIPEGSETDDEASERRRPTPLHPSPATATATTTTRSAKKRPQILAVTCNNCRPTTRDTKTTSSVAPVTTPNNNNMLKSILSTLSRRSPKPDHVDLSRKILRATKERDEAVILHASKLKNRFTATDRVVEDFRFSVSEARAAVKSLSKALIAQIRHTNVKVFDRVFGVRFAQSESPRTLILYLEGVLNSALFEDFESTGFARGSRDRILNPVERCKGRYAAFNELKGLTWEEVLSKGTRHFSEEFSGFCDRKMSEIVGVLGWNRAWPEPLLQAFFGASKGVWLVHLLANSVHPGLGVFRVESGLGFDSVYMEDVDRGMESDVVRVMVVPGFYVYDSVIKCKVLCRYSSNSVTNLGANSGSGTYER